MHATARSTQAVVDSSSARLSSFLQFPALSLEIRSLVWQEAALVEFRRLSLSDGDEQSSLFVSVLEATNVGQERTYFIEDDRHALHLSSLFSVSHEARAEMLRAIDQRWPITALDYRRLPTVSDALLREVCNGRVMPYKERLGLRAVPTGQFVTRLAINTANPRTSTQTQGSVDYKRFSDPEDFVATLGHVFGPTSKIAAIYLYDASLSVFMDAVITWGTTWSGYDPSGMTVRMVPIGQDSWYIPHTDFQDIHGHLLGGFRRGTEWKDYSSYTDEPNVLPLANALKVVVPADPANPSLSHRYGEAFRLRQNCPLAVVEALWEAVRSREEFDIANRTPERLRQILQMARATPALANLEQISILTPFREYQSGCDANRGTEP